MQYNKLSSLKFEWQRGYGAFTHSHSRVKTVINYILNQAVHKKKPFEEEYYELLKKFEVEFNEKYLFD